MNKDLCFIIQGIHLYKDMCLIKDDIPIFFTCINEKDEYYLVLCVDEDLPKYNIIKVRNHQLNNMLQGIITMRDIFMIQDKYWEVIPHDSCLEKDVVLEKLLDEMDLEELPDEGAYFELYNNDLKTYAEIVKEKMLEGNYEDLKINRNEFSDSKKRDLCINIQNDLNNISLTVNNCKNIEIKQNLISQDIILPKYKEESCIIENEKYIDNQNIMSKKILVENIFLGAA